MSAARPSTLFLLGAARSGTSLLYKALCLHPDAAFFNNWMRRLPSHPSMSVTNRLARATPATRRRVWFGGGSNAYVYSRKRRLTERLYPMPVEGEPVFASCGIPELEASDHASAEQRHALRRAVTGTVRWGGGACFINKRIANCRRIPLLAQTFPEARFVDITRDGRAVALSLSRVDWWEPSVVWWYGGTPAAWRAEGRDPWELCARNWVEEVLTIDSGLAGIAPERVLRLTYEEFVARPRESVRRIAAFGELDDDVAWRSEIATLRFSNRNETWRSEMAPDVIARIEAVQGEELHRRGYR